MAVNNMVKIVITKDNNWEISYFEKENKDINDFTNLKTKLILTTAIESKLFQYIESLDKDRTDVIIEWLLLLEDEANIIHCKPFIRNNDILKYLKTKQCVLN